MQELLLLLLLQGLLLLLVSLLLLCCHLAQELPTSVKPLLLLLLAHIQLTMLHHHTCECLDGHKQCVGISPQRPGIEPSP